jgi:hypothetical protein
MKFNEIKITSADRKRYPLPEKSDLDILRRIKYLEKLNIKKEDKDLLKLIKSQLLSNWGKPLIVSLNKLIKKYKK